jgi:hypothetical protein
MSSTSVKGDALGLVMISSSKPPNPSSPCFILPQQNMVYECLSDFKQPESSK